MNILLAILFGIVFSEFVGYWVHKVLHSGKIVWLSESHMVHHMKIYPPSRLRTEKYINPPHAKFAGVGLEWAIPILLVLIPTVIILNVVGLGFITIASFIISALVWAGLFLSWMHDQFHLKKSRFKGRWFKKARKLHDIHHLDMDSNLGITFFWFDRIFGTLRNKV